MYARVHALETGPETYERGYSMVRDVLLPWARESTGFCGLIGLADASREESLVITLWADEASAEASSASADRLSGLAATAAGASRAPLRAYEVTIYDVPTRVPEPDPAATPRH
jgi:hypothetical protein